MTDPNTEPPLRPMAHAARQPAPYYRTGGSMHYAEINRQRLPQIFPVQTLPLSEPAGTRLPWVGCFLLAGWCWDSSSSTHGFLHVGAAVVVRPTPLQAHDDER